MIRKIALRAGRGNGYDLVLRNTTNCKIYIFEIIE